MTPDTTSIEIRPARTEDIPLLHELIKALAEYERLLDHFVLNESDLKEALFGEKPSAEAIIAFYDGESAGFALFFTNFSTFLGKPGLYLEDLFVRPALRSKGVGKALLKKLAEIAQTRNYGRMEWAVLNWNEPAIEFYKSLGARPIREWTIFRMNEAALGKFLSREAS